MELLLLMGFGLVSAGLFALNDDDEEVLEGEPVGDGFRILDDGEIVGSNGNDTLSFSDLPDEATEPFAGPYYDEIASGSGDDLIDLQDPDAGPALWDSPLIAETIDGGAGNDTIVANAEYGHVIGGEGDDSIHVGSGGTNGLVVEADDGNDTIDGRNVEDGRLLGGAGDDVIITGGGGIEGTGYVVSPDGGEGDDLIRYDVVTSFEHHALTRQIASGGSGADVFEVSVDEGAQDFLIDPDNNTNSFVTVVDDDTWQVQTLNITDFEPGVDKLVLQADRQSDEYALASVRLEDSEDRGGNPITNVIMSYEHDTDVTREVAVILHAAGVDWTDIEIEYEGQPYPTPAT